MLALEDERVSPRLKAEIERILEISVSEATAEARRKLAASEWQRSLAARRATQQAQTALPPAEQAEAD